MQRELGQSKTAVGVQEGRVSGIQVLQSILQCRCALPPAERQLKKDPPRSYQVYKSQNISVKSVFFYAVEKA